MPQRFLVGPANVLLQAEHLLDARPNFLVCDKPPLVELSKPLFHLLAETSVMVKVTFDEPPNGFFRAPVIFCSNAGYFRLKFGVEGDFLNASLGATRAGVKLPAP